MTVEMTDRITRDLRAETHYRSIEIDRAAIHPDERAVPASLSSETEVDRWFGTEVLSHAEGAFNLVRAEHGLPLLWNHNSDQPIGRVDNIRLEGGKLRGVLRFSKNAKAEEVWNDVRDGFLSSISIGYRIVDWEEQANNRVFVTQAELLETSVVSVPADHTVGIGRAQPLSPLHSREVARHTPEVIMIDETKVPDVVPVTTPPVAEITHIRREHDIVAAKARQDATAAERRRVADVGGVFDLPAIPRTAEMSALRARAIDDGWSADQTRDVVLRALGELSASVVDHRTINDDLLGIHHEQDVSQRQQPGNARVSVAVDELDTFKRCMQARIEVVSGLDSSADNKQVMREWDYAGRGMTDIMFRFLELKGQSTRGMDKFAAAKLLVRSGPHSHSDFTSILANVATKSVLKGWTETPTTWQLWCNTGSLPDFKQATIAGLGAFSDLDTIPASGGPYKHGTMDDIHETASLATYGKLFGISRVALVNDDLGEFSRVGMKMGATAARKINALAYAVLTGNQTMTEDNTACFHANHSNYVASSSGAAPSTTTLNAAYTAMAKQAPPKRTGDTVTAYLNLAPKFLIVPRGLEVSSWVLINSAYDVNAVNTTSSKNFMTKNFFEGKLTVVSDALLDAALATGWYLAVGQNDVVDTVTMFFLNGQQEPYLEDFDKDPHFDGVTYKVRVDAVARALDYRGLYYNYGA